MSFYSFSQDNKNDEDDAYAGILKSVNHMLLSSEIEMDIDKTIFSETIDNSHFTADKKSGIVAMLMPSAFEKLEEELKNEESKDGSIIIDKGELKNEGKRILYLKQSLEQDGETYFMLMFAKEYKEEVTIMVTSIYESNKDDEYKKHLENAIKSAVVVEKK